MKKYIVLIIAICTFVPFANFACGPWFPETYLDDGKYHSERKPFESSYSWECEVEYIIFEKFKDLSKWHIYPDSTLTTEEAELIDYKEKSSQKNRFSKSTLEFELYRTGKEEMRKNNTPEKIPSSWIKLLKLPQKERRYRTIWACYMIGNLYSSAGKHEIAKKFYKAVRVSSEKRFKDSLGLAHATYKREFLSAVNPKEKLNAALKAMAYYLHAKDNKRYRFILFEVDNYIEKLQNSKRSLKELLKDRYLKELLISTVLTTHP